MDRMVVKGPTSPQTRRRRSLDALKTIRSPARRNTAGKGDVLLQTHSDAGRGNSANGRPLLDRMLGEGHGIQIHTGSEQDHQPHAELATTDNVNIVPMPSSLRAKLLSEGGSQSTVDGIDTHLEATLVRARHFLQGVEIEGNSANPTWVRPPYGFTYHGSSPEPDPNVVKEIYKKLGLHLGPEPEGGYANGNNWHIDSTDSMRARR